MSYEIQQDWQLLPENRAHQYAAQEYRIDKQKKASSPPSSNDCQKTIDWAIAETCAKIERIRSPDFLRKMSEPQHKAAEHRLKLRQMELAQVPNYFKKMNFDVKKLSIQGWGSNDPKYRCKKEPGRSQFEAIIAENDKGEVKVLPLSSRIAATSGEVVDLCTETVDHGDHDHAMWDSGGTTDILARNLNWEMGEDEEGCPCCVAGLDFDEFATAVKEFTKASGGGSEAVIKIADFNSASHWGIFLGIAGPLGLIGLTAAIRNIDGSLKNIENLQRVIDGVAQDIQYNQEQGNLEAAEKLTAFKRSLEYSKLDGQFNLVVPGAINGVASILVLSTAIFEHPFALPVIAMYTSCQLFRNVGDLARVWNQSIEVDERDSDIIQEAKDKVNRVGKEKRRFFFANSMGFASFTAGCVLTFLSLPAIPVGVGLAMLPVGLTLLGIGAASTGYMNNIWIRKFKPRNGPLGISRLLIKGLDHTLKEIANRRRTKKALKAVKMNTFNAESRIRWRKRWLKVLTALPEVKDLPQSWARRVSKFLSPILFFLPNTGSAATSEKHRLNKQIAKDHHDHPTDSLVLQLARCNTLLELIGSKKRVDSTTSPDKILLITWKCLRHLKVEKDVIKSWLNEGFVRPTKPINDTQKVDKEADHCDHHDCCEPIHGHQPVQEAPHDHHGHDHSHHDHHNASDDLHNHDHDHHCSGCDVDNGEGIPGLKKNQNLSVGDNTNSRATFNFTEFMQQASDHQKRGLNEAIDYYLLFVHAKKMQYQQYGLIDHYWQLKKLKSVQSL